MTNPVSDFFTDTFDLLSSGQFENLVFRPESQGGKFLQALSLWVRCRRRFFFQKNGPHIFTSPELLGTLPQALFFSEKWPPYFYKPWASGYVAAGAFFFFRQKRPPYFYKPWASEYVAAGAFFFGKKGPHISGHGSTRSGHGSSGHGTEIFGTARIHQIWARHGTGHPCE